MSKRKRKAAPDKLFQPAPEVSNGPPTKSDLIRAYAKQFKSAGPKEIATALSVQGVVVTPAHVSTTLSTDKRKRRHSKPASVNRFGQLIEPKKMVVRLGGIDAAREALNAYAVIVG